MILTHELDPQELHAQLKNIKDAKGNSLYSLSYCEEICPLINEINTLKQETNACILAHSYVPAEITYGVSDFVGDSYELSKKAKAVEADRIVFAGVRFMGETAKLLSPQKEVLVPATDPGCTLAEAISAEEIQDLRAQYPDYTFVCYINTTAAVKAACDVCVTSANIYKVVQRIPSDKIFFVPDRLMALNLIAYLKKHNIPKTVKYVDGTCYMHEEFPPETVSQRRQAYPGVKVVCHPECQPAVCDACDYVGSTSQILKYVKDTDAPCFSILTDDGISARIQHDYPDKSIVGESLACKYMKSNSLTEIARVLKAPQAADRIEIPANIRDKALACINAMFAYTD